MLIYHVISIPVTSCFFNMEIVERKKNYKNNEYLKDGKSFLDEIKLFFIIFKMLAFGKI